MTAAPPPDSESKAVTGSQNLTGSQALTGPRAVLVQVPDLGSGPIRIGCWFAEPGDLISAGESLLELIVPGIRIEIDAPVTGRLQRIERPAGSSVETRSDLCLIEPLNPAQPESVDAN